MCVVLISLGTAGGVDSMSFAGMEESWRISVLESAEKISVQKAGVCVSMITYRLQTI
jgi:hypothetical protein